MATNRLARVHQHIQGKEVNNSLVLPSDDEIVIVSAVRTPICKAKRGAFKDTTPDILLSAVLQGVLNRSNIDPTLIGDISIGNVLQPGGGAVAARVAQMLAGIPYTVPLSSVNRQCSSGLQAFVNIASAISSGIYDIGIAGGVESMSSNDMSSSMPDLNWDIVNENNQAKDCLIPMGITSENVAERYSVSRQQQDEFAVLSQNKAAEAQERGLFDDEIVSVETKFDDETGETKTILVTKDDGIRKNTTIQNLSKLKPSFKPNGTTTAGNSSQVSDGAAAILVTRRSIATTRNLGILGVFKSYAVVGVPPDVMGIGPAFAIPVALQKAGLTIQDVDIFEINEAFASQCIYCVQHLGIPIEKVNPNGGAIALGHPLGCTGARQIATLLHELRRRNQRYGVVSMCIGTGMGAAAVFENPFASRP